MHLGCTQTPKFDFFWSRATVACFRAIRWSSGLILVQCGMLFGRRELNFWILEQGNSECVRSCVSVSVWCASVRVCMCVCLCARA